jgi:hypothetical protein
LVFSVFSWLRFGIARKSGVPKVKSAPYREL